MTHNLAEALKPVASLAVVRIPVPIDAARDLLVVDDPLEVCALEVGEDLDAPGQRAESGRVPVRELQALHRGKYAVSPAVCYLHPALQVLRRPRAVEVVPLLILISDMHV